MVINDRNLFSSLSESSFIPTPNSDILGKLLDLLFSSLSESSFIPTPNSDILGKLLDLLVLISFREQLHSYNVQLIVLMKKEQSSSHLFQRVASFLLKRFFIGFKEDSGSVLISFREQLHSYYLTAIFLENFWIFLFSSLSESSFIPTYKGKEIFHRFQRGVLISFREQLHSYYLTAIFLENFWIFLFSSLSESSFIPTYKRQELELCCKTYVLISFREQLHSYDEEGVVELFRNNTAVLISFREQLHSYDIYG